MRNIATLPVADRRALFNNTANKTGLTTAIVEKDFWVCWILDYLFQRSDWKESLAFKGGTSLSKAYNLIERFSEDIDLVLDWRLIGYSHNEPWAPRSRNQQDKFNKEANEKTVAFLKDDFVPSLYRGMSSELGIGVVICPVRRNAKTIRKNVIANGNSYGRPLNCSLE